MAIDVERFFSPLTSYVTTPPLLCLCSRKEAEEHSTMLEGQLSALQTEIRTAREASKRVFVLLLFC